MRFGECNMKAVVLIVRGVVVGRTDGWRWKRTLRYTIRVRCAYTKEHPIARGKIVIKPHVVLIPVALVLRSGDIIVARYPNEIWFRPEADHSGCHRIPPLTRDSVAVERPERRTCRRVSNHDDLRIEDTLPLEKRGDDDQAA